MNFVNKIRKFIKDIFSKKDKIKMLDAPQAQQNMQKEVIDSQKQKSDFVKSLKVNIIDQPKKKKIEILICEGDGLGIKPKMSA